MSPSTPDPEVEVSPLEGFRLLRDVDHVRLRPQMYIGSVDSRGLHRLVNEWVLLAAAEAQDGFAKQLSINLLADGGCRLFDDGRPMPVDPGEGDNRRLLELFCTSAGSPSKGPLRPSPHRYWPF